MVDQTINDMDTVIASEKLLGWMNTRSPVTGHFWRVMVSAEEVLQIEMNIPKIHPSIVKEIG
jgi:hypothetical protein